MERKLEVRSCRIGMYKGKDMIDVSVGSGQGWAKYLAPSWEMVRELKRGHLSWERYEEMYLGRLRDVWRNRRWVFRRLFKMGRVTFVCYCRSDEKCHRRLLREVVTKIGAKYGLEVVDGGELEIRWY